MTNATWFYSFVGHKNVDLKEVQSVINSGNKRIGYVGMRGNEEKLAKGNKIAVRRKDFQCSIA
jgi:hypothetical protein